MNERTPTAEEQRNRALVEAAFARWGEGVGNPYELLAEDVSWTIVGVGAADNGPAHVLGEAFMSQVIAPFGARMRQGLRPTIRQLVTDGENVIIFFDASGVAKDGVTYANTYAWFWQMRDGQVVRAHAFFDAIAFNDLWRRLTP